jgi:hypothetical protein
MAVTLREILLVPRRLFLSSEAVQAKIDRLVYQYGLYSVSRIKQLLLTDKLTSKKKHELFNRFQTTSLVN